MFTLGPVPTRTDAPASGPGEQREFGNRQRVRAERAETMPSCQASAYDVPLFLRGDIKEGEDGNREH